MATSLNLELLIKLLRLTTSANDMEALASMRKANDQLKKVGGDWETLLRGKVTLIADPFDNLQAPPKAEGETWRAASTPPPPQPKAPIYQQAPPRQASSGFRHAGTYTGRMSSNGPTPSTPPPSNPQSPPKATRRNAFSGHCFACGQFTDAQKGWIFQPNNKTNTRWEILCDRDATSTKPIPSRRAKPIPASTADIFRSI